MIEIERETRLEQGHVLPVCIVAGNKCDLQGMRQILARDGLEWSKSRGYGFMETSAREMVNIEETFARMFAIPTCRSGR
jgi:GTPase KRas